MHTSWTRWLAGGIALAAALAVSLIAQSPETDAAADPVPPTHRVRVATVEPGGAGASVRFPGRVRSLDRARLAFSVSGRLAVRPVHLGDRVAEGELVARIESQELSHRLREAEARLAEIAAQLTREEAETARVEALVGKGAATAEELESVSAGRDRLLASRDAAGAALEEARRRLGESRLTAPFAGTVVGVGREPGEWVDPGETVLDLAGSGALEVIVEIPSSVARDLTEGSRVVVERADGPRGLSIDATILSVGSAAVGPGSLRPARIAIPEETDRLAPGDPVEVVLGLGNGGRLTVPLAAIVDPAGTSPAVFRVAQGSVERIPVGVRSFAGERVEIEGALGAGDEVVVAGQGRLLDGEPVEVIR